MEIRILVTGSRDWNDIRAVENAIMNVVMDREQSSEEEVTATIVHGDCPTGADRIARDFAREVSFLKEEPHPAHWGSPRDRSAGPRRNQKMVDLGADVCIALIKDNSRGATHCMNASVKAGIPTNVFRTP